MPHVERYPPARKVDQVDDYHGTSVADPYRWMEDLSDPDLQPWLDEQVAISEDVLGGIGCRSSFRDRIGSLVVEHGVDMPRVAGGRWFQGRSEPQKGLYLLDGPDDPAGRLVFSSEPRGDVIVADVMLSPDGTKILWADSVGGSDWRTWRVKDIDTGDVLSDEVKDTKLWACWLPDASGFFYVSFPSDGEGSTRQTVLPQLKLHRLGTSSSDDELVYENRAAPTYFYPQTAGDRIVLTFLYAPGSSVAWAPADGPWAFKTVYSSDGQMWLTGVHDDTFYIATTNDAPYGCVVAVEADGSDVRVVVGEADVPLPMVARASLAGDRIFVARDHLGLSTITLCALDGSSAYEVPLPGPCRFVNANLDAPVTASPDGRHVYLQVIRPTSPGSVLRHDTVTRTTDVFFEAASLTDVEIAAEVVWATSRDGTKVPMTIVRAADHASASPPVVIEGYGGGGDSMEPYDFVPWKVAWLEAGGAIASAHIRGGGELGAEWQAAAARGGKLLAMEDFIACASWLHDNGWTRDRVAIQGRSSGAMLAAAATVARPDLFAACIAEVGMFDPLRYHHFGLGKLMIPEYGTSEVLEDFQGMIAYSPQHNVPPVVELPAFLMTVHTDDDRVAPGQPFKFAATIQEAQAGEAPLILRLRAGAGHHTSASSEGDAAERADILAFLGKHLGLPTCS